MTIYKNNGDRVPDHIHAMAEEAKAGRVDRREFLALASVFGASTAMAYGMLGLADPTPARAQDVEGKKGGILKVAPVVASDSLERTVVWAEDDPSVEWAGAFALYGGHGTTQSSMIVYQIEPGKRLGWHTDATEETQYIIAGTGELHMEDGTTHPVGPGSILVLPTSVRHDLVNTGTETLRAVAFFAAAMFTQTFDNVMLPPKSHVLGTPNRAA